MTTPCATCGAPLPADANYCPKCGRLVASSSSVTKPSAGIPKWLIVLLVVCALAFLALPVFAVIAAIAIPNMLHARALSEMSADKANLKSIAIAVEQFAVDHDGKYPDRLPQLVPTYMKQLPNVPGGDGTGAYDYHHPGARGAAYEIWDDGSMDTTTFRNLKMGGADGPECLTNGCKYVVYRPDVGIIGLPGATSR